MSSQKRFLIPAFICVDAASMEAAEEAAQALQAPSLQRATGARLYLDDTLKTAEIPTIVNGDPQIDPHSLLAVPALRIAMKSAGQLPPPPKKVHVFPDSAPAERIIGVFAKQRWGGFKGKEALPAGEVDFDATATVLRLDLEKILELEDNFDLRDQVGTESIEYDGPFEVYVADEVEKFFGVRELDDITQDMLDAKRAAYGIEIPEPEGMRP